MKRSLAILVFSLLLLPYAHTQSISEHTSRREAIEREIKFLDKQLRSTRTQHQTSTKELSLIQRKIANRKKLLRQIEEDIMYIHTLSRNKEREIEKLNKQLERLKTRYSHLVYSAYKNRDKNSWILHILASKNLQQGYRRYSYLRNFSRTLNTSAQEIREKNKALQQEIVKLNKMKEESLAMKAKREGEYRSLAKEEMKARNLIKQLSRKEQQFRTQIKEKRQEVERLNREIEKILAQATKENKEAGKVETTKARVLSSNFEKNKGKLPWPVKEGVIIEHFGQHNHPVFKHIKLPFNNGINISTNLNAEVLAVFDGIVKQILVMPGYNQCVLIQHGNYYTFYTKMEMVRVKTGQSVSTGEVIGTLAENEGNSTIHFQLWNGTTKQNPEHWISK